MEEFLAMGGYAQFVWPAYAISALAIGALIVATWRRAQSVRQRLKSLEGADRSVEQPGPGDGNSS